MCQFLAAAGGRDTLQRAAEPGVITRHEGFREAAEDFGTTLAVTGAVSNQEGEAMLEQSAQSKPDNPPVGKPTSEQVSCFVCKQQVGKDQVVKLHHHKANDVWVCEQHLKK